MVARRKTVRGLLLARRVFAAAFLALLCSAPVTVRAGELAYTLQISNSYIGLPGSTAGSSSGFGGGSVLEQWIDESRPFVRITNTSSSPALNLFGAKLDLTQSASIISDCQWVEGLGAPEQTWNWNADLTSAFFQFRTPLAPGESVLMRLSTAPRPGMEEQYTQNQQLFHPVLGNCLCSQNYGSVDVFTQVIGSKAPVDFLPSGQPSGPGLTTITTPLDKPLTPSQITDPSTVTETGGMYPPGPVPVPEPSTIVLAASAAVLLAFVSRCRGRQRRLAA